MKMERLFKTQILHNKNDEYIKLKNNHSYLYIINKMSKKKIIKGYKGIMDLDLTNIQEEYKKDAVEQHYREIEEYKKEQRERPPHLRYENTIERIKKQQDLENRILSQKLYKLSEEQLKHNESYNNSKI